MFSRPYGTERNSHRLPATEVAGYSQPVPTGPVVGRNYEKRLLSPTISSGGMGDEANREKV